MKFTTVGLLCHPSGGICTFPAIEIETEHIGLLMLALESAAPTPHATALYEFLQSLTQPRIAVNVTEDVPVYFLGYTRQHKATFLVRLREAWNTLMGRPSQAYFTDENGDYADGTFKNAMRVTLDGGKVRGLAPTVYNACLQSDGTCVIPLFPVPSLKTALDDLRFSSVRDILSVLSGG